ncbi:superoxide dismutase family protein [Aurantimonas sp. VKM B-3413]|uniref:superoxide dismutase family protein n=1 Tax=Aurantimonas sp. VKM B-3413 TaxID=2779401 RepID=UPI001E54E253|nr:superoxide dismutase family protein [Aurantimonas sp. VKM B-3413]MCB8836515.1 superoxide dismutase family protein [Aurantimonas sp. VKM B-3413]
MEQMKTIATTALTTAFLLAGAALPGIGANAASLPDPVNVTMTGPDGSDRGTVSIVPTPHGLLLEAQLTGLADGTHAFHIHETGRCEGDFSSAGGHFNPASSDHGYLVEKGPHAGDMPNVTAANGKADFTVFQSDLGLAAGDANSVMSGSGAPLNDADGSALVVHAGADDYHSQPSGAAGGRVACGVIYPPK